MLDESFLQSKFFSPPKFPFSKLRKKEFGGKFTLQIKEVFCGIGCVVSFEELWVTRRDSNSVDIEVKSNPENSEKSHTNRQYSAH